MCHNPITLLPYLPYLLTLELIPNTGTKSFIQTVLALSIDDDFDSLTAKWKQSVNELVAYQKCKIKGRKVDGKQQEELKKEVGRSQKAMDSFNRFSIPICGTIWNPRSKVRAQFKTFLAMCMP